MGIISSRTIEQIRDANEIVETVGSYLPLKRHGSNFRALCPFHKEKTPSFNVNSQRQIYHCFGCHAGGDVFKFVMEFEGVDFVTAVRMLARRAGIPITFEEGGGSGRADHVDLQQLLEELAGMYRHALESMDEAEAARSYLETRRIPDDVAKDFMLGYAPKRPDTLVRWAKKKEYPLERLEAAGMLARSEGRSDYYDRFRGRLMFPVRNHVGHMAGFSARLLDSQAKTAKYVNSPETVLFKKSKLLYALDRARRAIVDSRRAIVCEGQIDVIRCHTAGFESAVAPQGTALTEEHADLLKRSADEVVLVFDADRAGQDAAQRSAELCMAADLAVLIAPMPAGQDPDSLIRDGGKAAFEAVLNGAVSLLDFRMSVLEAREDLTTDAGLRRVSRAVINTIRLAPSETQREQFVQRAAARLHVSPDALWRELARTSRTRRTPQTPAAASEVRKHPREEMMLAELLLANEELHGLAERYLPLDTLTDPDCKAIVRAILAGGGDDRALLAALSDQSPECLRLAAQIQAAPAKHQGDTFAKGDDLKDTILRIRRRDLERQRQELRRRIDGAAPDERDCLVAERKQITIEINKLGQGWDQALPLLELHT